MAGTFVTVVAAADKRAPARNFLGLVSEQSLYNLIDRTIELEVLPACKEYGLGLIPWSPLKGGVLGGVLKKAAEGRRGGTASKSKAKAKTRTRSSATKKRKRAA